MEEVKVGRVYRHFKGNYYVVENIGLDSETRERLVIYRHLYEEQEGSVDICVRPEKMFLEEIPERPDNITGQKHRFELVKEIAKNYLEK